MSDSECKMCRCPVMLGCDCDDDIRYKNSYNNEFFNHKTSISYFKNRIQQLQEENKLLRECNRLLTDILARDNHNIKLCAELHETLAKIKGDEDEKTI